MKLKDYEFWFVDVYKRQDYYFGLYIVFPFRITQRKVNYGKRPFTSFQAFKIAYANTDDIIQRIR